MTVILLAHRGFRRHGPENSIPGFRGIAAAAAAGVPLGVELDVRRTADGVLVVVHDDEVIPDGLTESLLFNECWYVTLKQLMGRKCPPTLTEVLALFDARTPLVDLDLKEQGYIDTVMEQALDAIAPERLMVTSHIPALVAEAAKAAPSQTRIGILVNQYWHLSARDLIELTQDLGANVLFPHYRNVTGELIGLAQDAGIELGSYTINDPDLLRKLAEDGVAFPCTNHPEMLLEELLSIEGADVEHPPPFVAELIEDAAHA